MSDLLQKCDPALTWIIPVYNGEKYIAQAIESILRQPCGDFAIIIVDDGSTDKTVNVVNRYLADERIRLIQKENGGVSSARNLGIANAKSDYIAFLDADDVVCKNAYDGEINQYLHQKGYDLISLAYYRGDQFLKCGNKYAVQDTEYENGTSLDPFKHCSSFIYSRHLLSGDNAICFPEGIKIREDVSFQFLVNNAAQKVRSIDKNWFVYRNNVLSVLHALRNPDFMLKQVVPAWLWCRSLCRTEWAISQCNVRLFAEITEYIRMGCMAGVPIAEIQSTVSGVCTGEIMENYNSLWNSSKSVYEEFVRTPQSYWWKQRVRGIGENIIRFIVRIPVFRTMYFKIKYKDDIGDIV